MPEAPLRMVTIAVTEDQHAVIRHAIDRVRASEHDDTITDGRALELVAADFIAGS